MKITLTDGYYITADAYNFILMKEYVVEKGKFAGNKTTKTVGYWSNRISGLKGCIKRYLEISSLEGEKSSESNFENFCGHLEASVEYSTDWIVSHIGDCVMAVQEAEQEIERLKKKQGDGGA